MSDIGFKSKNKKQIKTKNVLESINEIGSQVVKTASDEVRSTSEEFLRQLLNQQRQSETKKSADINPGESIDMSEVMSGNQEQKQKVEEQLYFERRMYQEENEVKETKLQELRLRLQAIQTEAIRIVNSTANLSQEVKAAVMQDPTSASEYQIKFYEDIIKHMVNFRKKIDSALVWMQNSNARAEKKNYWSQYKKKGSSFLLSGESYSQRSAG